MKYARESAVINDGSNGDGWLQLLDEVCRHLREKHYSSRTGKSEPNRQSESFSGRPLWVETGHHHDRLRVNLKHLSNPLLRTQPALQSCSNSHLHKAPPPPPTPRSA